jgi:hypothetical protein
MYKTKLLSTENVIYKNLDYGDIIIDVDDKRRLYMSSSLQNVTLLLTHSV